MTINRRQFAQSIAATICASALEVQASTANPWGGPVVDCHFHLRPSPESNVAHLDGCGVSNAVLLARENAVEQIRDLQKQYPGRFLGWFASADITKPDAEQLLSQAVKNGAIGFGEIKFHVAAYGPELRRAYALAADLNVPIVIHFQEVPHTPTEGVFSTGIKNFEVMLKAYPKTRFIGHADAFWANISAAYVEDVAYPTGKVVPGGITDKLLSDYPNLYGDSRATRSSREASWCGIKIN
jgi:hypothetical protein